MAGIYMYLCSAGGKFCNHSTEFCVCAEIRICRFDTILSYIMKRNIITLTNESGARGGVVVKALRYKPAGRGSIPDGVIGIFQ